MLYRARSYHIYTQNKPKRIDNLVGLSHVVGTSSLDDGGGDISLGALEVSGALVQELGGELTHNLLHGSLHDRHLGGSSSPGDERKLGTLALLISSGDAGIRKGALRVVILAEVGEQLSKTSLAGGGQVHGLSIESGLEPVGGGRVRADIVIGLGNCVINRGHCEV